MRILIADDEPLIRMGVRRILEEAGHEVVGEVASGREALELVDRLQPDLLVLDIRMEPTDGIEVARRVTGRVPVVFLTAYGDRELLEAAREVGAYAYITKPLVPSELLAAVTLSHQRFREVQRAREALEARKVIERAKGILMKRLGLDEEEAYRLLQRRARNQRKTMREVAQAILDSDALISHRRPPR
ncbi:MAG: response regulator [Armatimonadota bacterium]|nr:response regulator [Armatimonadota bacterium]MDR7438514.1 response regulator [Armatimonadota bacterium]MDR7562322.1 response regulator [Armatimonadota bacterium]MDR7568141.1 response regulator [Armatimonadota bacterium]MDR7602427.1 response regulator [Armatimonadota bacterium]